MSQQVSAVISQCDTGLVHGLSRQCIEKMNRMVKTPVLVEVVHPLIDASGQQVNAFLQPHAAESLIAAVNERNSPMIVNSMLRSTIQQSIIRTQYEQYRCGITAAAIPGRSNHENGLAIDIEDPHGWEPYLANHGWVKLGPWDDMHFDCWEGRKDLAWLQICAFQQLWNSFNPTDLIAIDGTYGPVTASKIQRSPCDGWS